MDVRSAIAALAMIGIGGAVAGETMPALTGNVYIHDPSIIEIDGRLVSFATGVEHAPDGGTPRTKTSPDGVTWTESGPLPGGQPDWVAAELGLVPPNLWAPSVSERDGVFYLYYSASTFGRNASAIGLMTNDALDPEDPAAGWRDRGMVLRSVPADDFNAIDPFRIDTPEGAAFLTYGSWWDGIRMVELDPGTGLVLDPDAPAIRLASRGGGAIEAPAILHHDGWYYLLVSFDHCCRGVASDYRIMVGRAEAVTGPYLDADDVPMTEGGGTELLSTTGRYRGPGGQEVFWRGGAPWLAFHYYDRDQGGRPKLQIAPLGFDADGWPLLGPLP